MLGLACAVVVYLSHAVGILSPVQAAKTLLQFTTLAIALVSIVVAYVVLWFCTAPHMDNSAILETEDRKMAVAMIIAARNAASESLAAKSRWWHFFLAAVGGLLYGHLLARGLAWLVA